MIKKIKEPNSETLQVFKDTDAGQNLEDVTDFNALLELIDNVGLPQDTC